MASLLPSSVAVTGPLKPDLVDFRKSTHIAIWPEKNPSFSHHRSYTTTTSERNSDSGSLDFREALSVLNEGAEVESAAYVPILEECVYRESVAEAQVVHAHIIKTGSHENLFLMTFLVNVYAKCGRMDYAHRVFDKLPQRNVVTWTSLMTGYAQNSQPELAIRVFQELLEAGAYPTIYTFGAVLSACSSLYTIQLGKQIHGYIIKYQIGYDTSVGNSLCSLYSKCHNFDFALKAFRSIPEKNVISWTTIISACGDNGQARTGLLLFVEMLSGGAEFNEFTLTSVLSLCCMMPALGFGAQVHSLIIKIGYDANIPIKNSIMYLYLKSGRPVEARRLFDEMETISLVTWNAMIAGYAQMMNYSKDELIAQHSGTEALRIFLKLNRSSLKPDLFTFSSVLTVCGSMVALEQGEQVHAQTVKTGFMSDVIVGSALVNMYNKCGSIERATKAFVEMSTRTLITWTSMITAYAQHGMSRQALQLFDDMRLAGVRPNKITFIGVFSACSHAGMVEEAMNYFEMMKNEYRIKPVVEHFACLIDMFVRLGKLEEAFDFIEKMEFEPNEFIWSILIAGCRSHGNMELGFYAVKRLLELKPKDAESYVLLLNMYLSAGRLKDVSKVRKLMRERKIDKLKDWSSISLKDIVHSFRPDDKSHPQRIEIYELLEKLINKAKDFGYVSHGALETAEEDDEAKPSTTIHHSERLAVAFGLLNMPRGASIRVIKCIGICRDCHTLIKFISLYTNREIIIRDRKRLHQFNDGHCSCGDFGSLV
ncbi:hypothetical protein Scep_001370 [Stephania cephalantha]|uniref:DYW domain-containing protein n=1 Tax=Stephania cephalantha TaxID=152367 RepID=A0AAP0Q4Z9_9MAGN